MKPLTDVYRLVLRHWICLFLFPFFFFFSFLPLWPSIKTQLWADSPCCSPQISPENTHALLQKTCKWRNVRVGFPTPASQRLWCESRWDVTHITRSWSPDGTLFCPSVRPSVCVCVFCFRHCLYLMHTRSSSVMIMKTRRAAVGRCAPVAENNGLAVWFNVGSCWDAPFRFPATGVKYTERRSACDEGQLCKSWHPLHENNTQKLLFFFTWLFIPPKNKPGKWFIPQ